MAHEFSTGALELERPPADHVHQSSWLETHRDSMAAASSKVRFPWKAQACCLPRKPRSSTSDFLTLNTPISPSLPPARH